MADKVNESYVQMLRERAAYSNGITAPSVTPLGIARPSVGVYAPTTSRPSTIPDPNRFERTKQLNAEIESQRKVLSAGEKLQAGRVRYSGGFGADAYGVGKGQKTGLAHQKGSAPYGLQSPFWNALQRANADMKKAGLGTFGITDGWRSYAAQVAVKKKKGSLAATPGRSVHGLGFAADLRLSKKQLRWLEQNGHRYGIARLPSESWHWQYTPKG